MKVLNVDLDGVVYDFVGALGDFVLSVAPERFDTPTGIPPKPTQWEFWCDWNMSFGEWRNWFRRGVEYGYIWREGNVLPGAVEYLWRLSDDDWHIRIVTDRLVHPFGHRLAVDATVEWLDKHNIPYRSLCFESDKGLFYSPTSFLVDDKPENVLSYAAEGDNWLAIPPSEQAVLFTTSANQYFHSPALGWVRKESWREVYEWLNTVE